LPQPPSSPSSDATPAEPGDGSVRLRILAEACASSRGGDRAAFEELNRRLAPGIRGFFLKRLRSGRGRDAVDDLCQRVWTGLWEAFDQGRYDPERASISTFVFAIASKTWMRFLRESRRGGQGSSDNPSETYDDVDALPGDESVAGAVDSAELLEAVRRCLRDRGTPGSLTDEEQAILVAAAAGASDRNLAERLGLAASTVNAKKQSGWEKLRRSLARLGHRAESPERGQSGEE
jgi:RNA polymerase sigma factor (sigma-70 family)